MAPFHRSRHVSQRLLCNSLAESIDDELLEKLSAASRAAEPAPWRAIVEGRDQLGGDNFIQVGDEDARGVDIYVSRDLIPAGTEEFNVIALSRTYLLLLVAEVRRL